MTLPRYFAAAYPGSKNIVYEVDAGVIKLARERLDLREDENLKVHEGDGRVALRHDSEGPYDLVMGDAFGHHSPPWHLTTQEAVEDARRLLREGGIYALNMIDFPPLNFAKAEIETVRKVFPHVLLVATAEALAQKDGSNFIVLASMHPLPVEQLQARIKAWKNPWTWSLVVADEQATAAFSQGALALRDDYAPVDQLVTVPFQYW